MCVRHWGKLVEKFCVRGRYHEYFLLYGQWTFWSNNLWRITTELNRSISISELLHIRESNTFFKSYFFLNKDATLFIACSFLKVQYNHIAQNKFWTIMCGNVSSNLYSISLCRSSLRVMHTAKKRNLKFEKRKKPA